MNVKTSKEKLAIIDQGAETLLQFLQSSAKIADVGITLYNRDLSKEKKTFAEILSVAEIWAADLQKNEVHPGDTVAIVLPTSFELVTAFFATQMVGAIPFCLATKKLVRLPSYGQDTARMIQAARCSLILTDDKHQSTLTEVASLTQAKVICVESMALSPKLQLELHKGEKNDIAMLQFSSGTTANPKPIALTHKNIITNVKDILSTFPGELRSNSGCSWLPLHHDMGLIGNLFTAVIGGGNLALIKPEDFVAKPALWLQALAETRATVSPCPTFALKMCVARIKDSDLEGCDLANLKMALVGAEHVQFQALKGFALRFAKFGFNFKAFIPVYGLAEATLAVTFSERDADPKMISIELEQDSNQVKIVKGGYESVSVGRALPHCQISIRDLENQECTEKHIGRILVKGPTLSRGYFNQSEVVSLDSDGWLDTGDLGFFYQGDLYIHGRAKDIIILNGRNHDPSFIERSIDEIAHEAIASDRSAAFAIHHEGVETFVLLVECKRKFAAQAKTILGQIHNIVIKATGLVAHDIELLSPGQLPRTTSGKIKRQASKELWQKRKLIKLASYRQ